MSRIIRHHTESTNNQNSRTIEVRSFSFNEELSQAAEGADRLSIQAVLDEQQRVRGELENETKVAREQLDFQRN
ncbi:MAG: hypothetical protein RR603_05405, partial [Kurthia sp.]